MVVTTHHLFVNVKDSSLGGIRWAEAEGEIDRLNAMVNAKVQKFLEQSSKTGKPLSPEVSAVLVQKSVVYKKRQKWVPIFYAMVSLALLSLHLDRPLTILTAVVFSFVWYDFFSGVLHVILDNPFFMRFPILHEPCLEFQWHHHLPLVSIIFESTMW